MQGVLVLEGLSDSPLHGGAARDLNSPETEEHRMFSKRGCRFDQKVLTLYDAITSSRAFAVERKKGTMSFGICGVMRHPSAPLRSVGTSCTASVTDILSDDDLLYAGLLAVRTLSLARVCDGDAGQRGLLLVARQAVIQPSSTHHLAPPCILRRSRASTDTAQRVSIHPSCSIAMR